MGDSPNSTELRHGLSCCFYGSQERINNETDFTGCHVQPIVSNVNACWKLENTSKTEESQSCL